MKLDDKTVELIAIGASITANCQPCLQYHVAKGREHGLDDDQIKDAIAVGKMVKKGAAAKMEKYAQTVLDECSGNANISDNECGQS
ncbi:MAG: carboxymuconolactone decarboxylase family protein [Planctomycetes bacterium]|nr:carboxymuconolactone decarboxylase family protein [Planctomycetota bacterium]